MYHALNALFAEHALGWRWWHYDDRHRGGIDHAHVLTPEDHAGSDDWAEQRPDEGQGYDIDSCRDDRREFLPTDSMDDALLGTRPLINVGFDVNIASVEGGLWRCEITFGVDKTKRIGGPGMAMAISNTPAVSVMVACLLANGVSQETILEAIPDDADDPFNLGMASA
jgi:hypothetical protein